VFGPPLLEDFESGLGTWTVEDFGVFGGREELGPFPWVQDTMLPAGQPGAAAFAVDPPDAAAATPATATSRATPR
jgi:hypothetical protein